MMTDTKNKGSIAAIKTGYLFFGAAFGAVLGFVAYVEGWL